MTRSGTTSPQATSKYLLDRAVATLREAAPRWYGRSIDERIADLETLRSRAMECAADLVADSAKAKGVDESFAGEDWVAGPATTLRTLRFLQGTLEGIRRNGMVPVPDRAIRERPDGQVTVDVLPGDRWDRILYRGWRATVRMDPEIGRGRARHHLGGIYTKPETATPGVAVILGAGNVSSISPLDLVHKLFVEGHVAVLKFNPVNEYLGPYLEHTFGPLITDGSVRVVYGGADVGEYLIHHPDVDEVHITGSEQTHNAVVFGGERRPRTEPVLRKPITSELGNVSPVVVVPGTWSDADLARQAEHVATQLLQNAGYNCNAAKVLVVPAEWDQTDAFLDALGTRLGARPDRPAYYPGSHERYRALVDAGGKVRTFGTSADGIPPTMIELGPDEAHPAFDTEAFCRVMALVRLGGSDVPEYLDRAVAFCNDRLRGTLNATLLGDEATLGAHERAVAQAVDRLRYGTVGINLWAAAGFSLGVTPWGAYPGASLDDVHSGIGFVHNSRLIDRPQKTVVRAPFAMWPKPAWSVFHRNSASTLRRLSSFEGDPRWWRLPGILSAAVRG